MIPIYEESSDHIQVNERKARHFPPHLHKSIEIIYVTRGSLAIGIGNELEEMNEGDFALVFPNLIHHYQVFQQGDNRNITLLASPSYFGTYEEILQNYRPASPVIGKAQIHPDILYAIKRLMELNPAPKRQQRGRGKIRHAKSAAPVAPVSSEETIWAGSGSKKPEDKPVSKAAYALDHAFIQIILARAIPVLQLRRRGQMKDQDIVYQTVAYVAAHFSEDITQDGMATALGVSPFVLSRVFSGIFHQNFNHYLNEVRLEHAAILLSESNETVTDICYDCGFQSQATFNRVFREKYHMAPRQFRQQQNNELQPAQE